MDITHITEYVSAKIYN